MARLRAVVTIHAPGLGGSPSDGHLAAATVNASWTASSAASISPRKRIRVATQRPYSRRNTSSTVTARESTAAGPAGSLLVGGVYADSVLEVPAEQRADLDRPSFCRRGELGPLQGGVQVGRVDDPEPGQVLLGLGVRPVGEQKISAGLADHRRRLRAALHAALEHERVRLLQLVAELAHPGPHLLGPFRWNGHGIVAVEREQVLGHQKITPVRHSGPVRGRPSLPLRSGPGQIDTLPPTMPEKPSDRTTVATLAPPPRRPLALTRQA